ncbi:Transcriptional regulator, AbiEi antitoxin, Type IV TA system [Isoptericola variabilis J7]|uniref:DUF559 domain-containing protein n=1 Tax=Isoptericola variabilis (strain 225) TaxID=743718 RepID=F6FR12_ISOV2|nr:hypothetical protein Isova_2242 [Isoptericola variabilis 225]TWH26026.1 Transcriptional regulator, AbiEi antitoxin, Type IV TA system [Isoptericola variabilis J7]
MLYDGERRAAIARRVRRGELARVRRGRYVTPTAVDRGQALQREARVLAMTAAVATSLRTEYWFSHETAALLHGLAVHGLREQVHVTHAWRPPSREAVGIPLVRHAVALPERDRAVVLGRPVTSLERTMVDCARLLPGARALVVADSALRAGADLDLVATILEEAAGHRGVRQARRVVGLADVRAESPGESILRWIVHEAQLDAPELAVEATTWRGTYWIDVAWPDLTVGIEFDGAVKYSGGRYGDPRQRLLEEKQRHDALTEAGWVLLRVTWDDLRRPDLLVARIRAALTSARARRGR